MKKKLDPIRTSERSPTWSPLVSSPHDGFSARRSLANIQVSSPLTMSAQVPQHGRSYVESPLYSALSPRPAPFSLSRYGGHHSPKESIDLDSSPKSKSRRKNSEDSIQGSYDYNGVDEMEIEETSSLKRLHIDDAYLVGQKRRAASPSMEDMYASVQSDPARRGIPPRKSPGPRLATIPQGTFPPILASRDNSFVPAASVPVAVGQARSPSRSPGGLSPTSCQSPHGAANSIDTSPEMSMKVEPLSTNASTVGSQQAGDLQKPCSHKLQAFYMCDCCPKKPKKFETAEELRYVDMTLKYILNCVR